MVEAGIKRIEIFPFLVETTFFGLMDCELFTCSVSVSLSWLLCILLLWCVISMSGDLLLLLLYHSTIVLTLLPSQLILTLGTEEFLLEPLSKPAKRNNVTRFLTTLEIKQTHHLLRRQRQETSFPPMTDVPFLLHYWIPPFARSHTSFFLLPSSWPLVWRL